MDGEFSPQTQALLIKKKNCTNFPWSSFSPPFSFPHFFNYSFITLLLQKAMKSISSHRAGVRGGILINKAIARKEKRREGITWKKSRPQKMMKEKRFDEGWKSNFPFFALRFFHLYIGSIFLFFAALRFEDV